MTLRAHLRAWSGAALRHIPAGAPYDVLDFRYAARSATNRWNEAGSPTLYLGGDEGVIITEWGRRFLVERPPTLGPKTTARTVYKLSLSVDYVLDLREKVVWDALSLTNAPYCFTSIGTARATARFIRDTTDAQALLVPSVGLLDHLDRWCLVLFLEKLPDPRSFISSVEEVGPLSMSWST